MKAFLAVALALCLASPALAASPVSARASNNGSGKLAGPQTTLYPISPSAVVGNGWVQAIKLATNNWTIYYQYDSKRGDVTILRKQSDATAQQYIVKMAPF